MSRLILIDALWRYQNRGHHGKRSKSRRYHVTHDIAIVVLTSPDVTALRLHHTSYGIIDQGIEISNACLGKLILIRLLINLLKNILKGMIVFLRDGILGRKPKILLCI